VEFSILVVDDEKNIRLGLGQALEGEGYNTHLAENGVKALEIIAKEF